MLPNLNQFIYRFQPPMIIKGSSVIKRPFLMIKEGYSSFFWGINKSKKMLQNIFLVFWTPIWCELFDIYQYCNLNIPVKPLVKIHFSKWVCFFTTILLSLTSEWVYAKSFIWFKNEPGDSGCQFSLCSDVIQKSHEPAFDMKRRVPGGDWVGFALHELIYDWFATVLRSRF